MKGDVMRTLRVFLVVVVSLVLLGGTGSVALAQESDAHVTGRLSCGPAADPTVLEDEAVALYLFPGRCTVTMTDPRVSGFMDSDLQEVCFKDASDACLFHIASVLTGPDGTWVGTAGSIHDASLTALPTWTTLVGTGAYEGWTFIFHASNQMDSSAEVSGIVYEGPPPPWGDALPLAPAE
jgi:hypothetical protein